MEARDEICLLGNSSEMPQRLPYVCFNQCAIYHQKCEVIFYFIYILILYIIWQEILNMQLESSLQCTQ